MKKKIRAKYLFLIVGILFVSFAIIVKADDPVKFKNNDVNAHFDVDYGAVFPTEREITIRINDIKAARRITGILYCLDSDDCDDNNNWHDVGTYSNNKAISSYQNSVGNDDMVFDLKVPKENLTLDVTYTDFEPMDVSYAKYKTDEELIEEQETTEYRMEDISRYKDEYAPIVTGYRGGDIVLPEDCTSGGCLLKFTLSDANYTLYKDRLDAANQIAEAHDKKMILNIGGNEDHLEFGNITGNTVEYRKNSDGSLYIEETEDTKSVFVYISKYFYQNNRANFAIGENKNRLLHENYIGLKVEVNKKYFDEGNDYGFLSFTESNSYKRNMTVFYGAQYITVDVDGLITPVADSTPGVGSLKHVYNKIESSDSTNYPITLVNGETRLGITSFYQPEYIVPIVLKNGDTVVQNITLNLERFAFRGNAGNVVLVDSNGINCRRTDMNPNCTTDSNTYVSTSYRGRIDTFYANGNTSTFKAIRLFDGDIGGMPILRADTYDSRLVYNRNEEFNPWAVAIFYRGDTVVSTKSFELGKLVKMDGYTTEPIANEIINKDEGDPDDCHKITSSQTATCANNNVGDQFTDYDSTDYEIFGYGMGHEIEMNSIKYFDEDVYKNEKIDIPLKLASKVYIQANGIDRIALFLTNGELKADDNNFPELTYGVGEGVIFTIDNRTWD